MKYISELEQKVQTLQTETTTLSTQFTKLQVRIILVEMMFLFLKFVNYIWFPYIKYAAINSFILYFFIALVYRWIIKSLKVRIKSTNWGFNPWNNSPNWKMVCMCLFLLLYVLVSWYFSLQTMFLELIIVFFFFCIEITCIYDRAQRYVIFYI